MIVFGTNTYGKVEQVPGVLYRATSFFHINYVPLIPTGGMVVVDRKVLGTAEHAYVKAPMSFLSFLMTYARAVLWFAIAVSAIMFMTAMFDQRGLERNTIVGTAVIAVGAVVLLWLSHRATRASHRGARALADQIGLDHEVIDAYFATKPSRAASFDDATPPNAEKSDHVFRLE